MGSKVRLCLFVGVAGLLLCNLQTLSGQEDVPELHDFMPKNGPISGGTLIHVIGNGFIIIGSARSKCKFEDSSHGSHISAENVVHNSTSLSCILPEIDYLPTSVLENGHRLRFSITAGDFAGSNEVDFFVYDLSSIMILDISPNEGLNLSRTLISISGVGFFNTGEITCNLESDGETLVPAAFINSTSLQCLLPTFHTSARVHVDVSLNGHPSANIQPEIPGSTNFTFFVTSPQLVSCEFSSSYVLLFLEFDREVEIGGESDYNTTQAPNCDIIFSDETLGIIGSDAMCFWYNSQQRSVVVQLTSTTTIRINSTISLRGDSIRTRAVEYSRLANGSITVSPSSDSEILIPVPVLEVPGSISYCGYFTVTAENSQHGGPRPLEYKWSIANNITGMGILIQDDTLQVYLPEDFTNQSTLIIPSNEFMDNTLYTIQVVVRNFLGVESTAIANVSKLNAPAPEVLILGSQVKQVIVNAEVRLEATVVLPGCLNVSGLVDYSWQIGTQMGLDIDYGIINRQSAVVVLPPYTLHPDSEYTASITTSVGGQSGNASVQLVTESVHIKARINGGIRRAVGVSDTFVLDGSISEGLNGNMTSDPQLLIIWKCANITNLQESVCCNTTSFPIHFESTLTNEIPAGTLSSGVYNFSLTLKYLDFESSTYQVVHILSHTPVPQVLITPPLRLECIPIHRKLVFHATIHSDLPGIAKWSSEYAIGYAQLDLNSNISITPIDYDILPIVVRTESTTVLYTSNATATPFVNYVSRSLVGNILLSNNPYRFRLEVTNIAGHTGFSEIDIYTESLPIAGHFDIRPLTGEPLATMFSLRALEWTDDIGDTPLSFQFGFKDGEDVYWLTGILTQNQLSTILPIVASGNRMIVLVLRIYDQNGAYTHYEHSVNLVYSGTSIDLLSLMQMIEEMSLEQGNWIEGLANLMSTTVTVNRDPDMFTQTDAFKLRAVNLINQLHSLSIPASKAFLNQLLSLLFESTVDVELSPDVSVAVSQLLESVIETYNAINEETVTAVEPGFSQEEAQLVLAMYANMISSNSQFNSVRIESDDVTDSMLNIIPKLGYGLCLQKGIAENASFIVAENIGSLKTSWINLPPDYTAASPCEECLFKSNEPVVVNFGNELFWKYLQRPCSEGRTSGCSGVCVISAQFKQDLRWQGSPYLSHIKSPFVQLSLIDPQDGSILEVQELSSNPIELTFPILTKVSDSGQLECVFWDEPSNVWSNIGCTTLMDSSTHVICRCDHLSEIVVLERCASGYYGENCTDVCPQDLWGQECLMSCDCSSRGTCSPHDGSCDCDPGWTGNRCQTVCPDGSWGKTCDEACLCENDAECNPVDGSCDCQPGWIGQYCNTPCPSGFYGKGCSQTCDCRTASECVDKVTGACTCLPGYIGDTCHETCPEYFYGLQCASECMCNLEGTRSCDYVTGICSCLEQWRGTFCDFEITAPPSPSPVASPQQKSATTFQIWWAVIPILLAAIAAVVIIIIVILCYKMKKRKKVLLISKTEKQEEKKVKDVVAVAEDHEVTMTKAKSYEVLVPKGSDLLDMFPKHKDNTGDFQEPPKLNGKLRWQIIQVLANNEEEETETKKVSFKIGDSKPDISGSAGSGLEHEASDKLPKHQTSHSDDEQMTEVVYKRGIYLDTNATLKDLRNAFIDSKQIEPEERMFRFLNSDVPGDSITIDTEDEVLLEQIEHRLVQHRTVYIETLAPETVQQELCVCGKYADMECTECQSRGYCSVQCQQEDWPRHELTCQNISAKRHKRHKKKKRKQKSRVYTPTWEVCICGKPADFECSDCGQQGYCSKECQNKDWSFHELHCQLGLHRNISAAPSQREKLETVEEVSELEDVSDHPAEADGMQKKPHSRRSDSTPPEERVLQLEVPETPPVRRKIKVAWMEEQKWGSTTDEQAAGEN